MLGCFPPARLGYLDYMRQHIDVKPWQLPVIVAALVFPSGAVWVLAGPGFGLLMGALLATIVVVAAIRLGTPETTERGPSLWPRRRRGR